MSPLHHVARAVTGALRLWWAAYSAATVIWPLAAIGYALLGYVAVSVADHIADFARVLKWRAYTVASLWCNDFAREAARVPPDSETQPIVSRVGAVALHYVFWALETWLNVPSFAITAWRFAIPVGLVGIIVLFAVGQPLYYFACLFAAEWSTPKATPRATRAPLIAVVGLLALKAIGTIGKWVYAVFRWIVLLVSPAVITEALGVTDAKDDLSVAGVQERPSRPTAKRRLGAPSGGAEGPASTAVDGSFLHLPRILASAWVLVHVPVGWLLDPIRGTASLLPSWLAYLAADCWRVLEWRMRDLQLRWRCASKPEDCTFMGDVVNAPWGLHARVPPRPDTQPTINRLLAVCVDWVVSVYPRRGDDIRYATPVVLAAILVGIVLWQLIASAAYLLQLGPQQAPWLVTVATFISKVLATCLRLMSRVASSDIVACQGW